MSEFIINGGNPLKGTVTASSAKNAAVALVIAIILCDEPCILENLPDISDIRKCLEILEQMGAKIERLKGPNLSVQIDATKVKTVHVPGKTARSMRASSYFLGALLGRFHEAFVPMPGGCLLGDRPIDQHLKAFSALGAENRLLTDDNGNETMHIYMQNENSDLLGNRIYFDFQTVGGTINAILAAVKAEGQTIIENAAKEPHVVDVANMLIQMGAKIVGAGTDTIKITGVDKLNGVTYTPIPDQIEIGTFMVATAATGGDVTISNVIPKHLEAITARLRNAGVNVVENEDDSIRVWVDKPITATNLKTAPHPGFPTDMQPQFSTLLAVAEGTSIVKDEIFDNRFEYTHEIVKTGADIVVKDKAATIVGTDKLKGAEMVATDLRAGAAMVIAGLVAEGTSVVKSIKYIDRGYEGFEKKLRSLGADIERVECPDNDNAEEESCDFE